MMAMSVTVKTCKLLSEEILQNDRRHAKAISVKSKLQSNKELPETKE
jgi:hypothetical protein